MRDLLIVSIVALGALYALRRPWIGVLLWTWLSLMNPHQAFGWRTATMQLAMVAAGATFIGLALTRERRNPFDRPAVWALLLFVVWMTIALPFSEYFEQSQPLWWRSMKIFLMVFVTIALIDNRKKLSAFIIVCAISLAYFGVKGGVFTIATGGQYRVSGPGGFIEGNNELAVALIMIVPLIYYFVIREARRWVKLALIASMVLTTICIIGTQSRGALLAVSAMAFFLWLKSRSKVFGGVAISLTLAGTLSFMPEHWWSRMETIQDYTEDNSALGRLNAWTYCYNVASDRFFGGGIQMYSKTMFERYSPDPDRVHAAHSIYFQALGELGFGGLILFLAIGIFTWLDARRLIQISGQHPELAWAADLGRMAQVSLIGFAVGGAFLSLVYFDLPYNFMAIVVCALHIAKRQALELKRALSNQPLGSSLGCALSEASVQPPGAPRSQPG